MAHAAPMPSTARPNITIQNAFINPPAKVTAAPPRMSRMPMRKTLMRPSRSPSAPPTVTNPASSIRVMLSTHWLAVTEIPKPV